MSAEAIIQETRTLGVKEKRYKLLALIDLHKGTIIYFTTGNDTVCKREPCMEYAIFKCGNTKLINALERD